MTDLHQVPSSKEIRSVSRDSSDGFSRKQEILLGRWFRTVNKRSQWVRGIIADPAGGLTPKEQTFVTVFKNPLEQEVPVRDWTVY